MLSTDKTHPKLRAYLVALLVLLSGCETLPPPEPDLSKNTIEEPAPEPEVYIASKADSLFAQTVLRELGYRAGPLDGIWGPRSATALKLFQSDNQLSQSGGRLSKNILSILQELTAHKREDFDQLAANSGQPDDVTPPLSSIAAQLSELESLSTGPQLIITDRPYHIFTKENPYSDVVTIIPSGTGIYVISKQQNWYQIEAITGHRGYITGQYLSN